MKRKVSLGLRIKMMFVLSWKRKKRRREKEKKERKEKEEGGGEENPVLYFCHSSFLLLSWLFPPFWERKNKTGKRKLERKKEGEFLSLLTPSLFCGSVLTKGGFSWQNSCHQILVLCHSFFIFLSFSFFFFPLPLEKICPSTSNVFRSPTIFVFSFSFFSLLSSLLILFPSRI